MFFKERQRPNVSPSRILVRGAKQDGDTCWSWQRSRRNGLLPRSTTKKRNVWNWCFLLCVFGILGPCWLLIVWQHQSFPLELPRGSFASPVQWASFQSSTADEEHSPHGVPELSNKHPSKANTKQQYTVQTPKPPEVASSSNNKSVRARRPIVGTFNGLPITQGDHNGQGTLQSFVRCTPHTNLYGNNKTWMYRSCTFTNLCFDLNSSQYVVFTTSTSAKESNPQLPQQETDSTIPSNFKVHPDHTNSLSMALGGLNSRWDVGHGLDRGSWKVQWFPEVRNASTTLPLHYYQLDDSVVWIPFHSFAGHNVGHLLWDDFYPLWRLSHIFGYTESAKWLLIRHVLKEVLYASCDIRRNKRMQCKSNFDKFLPLLDVSPSTFSSSRLVQLRLTPDFVSEEESNSNKPPPPPVAPTLVCAKHAIAGLGMLTDHGNHDHGWQEEQGKSWVPHNLGKGRQFYDFSQFALSNIRTAYGIHPPPTPTTPHKSTIPIISFSVLSSRDWDRRLDFAPQVDALRKTLSKEQAHIRTFALWNMTLPEQLQVAVSSNIFVSTCGGASMTATFLPRGASLIIFYNPMGGWDFETQTTNGHPARLDWDLLNNAAHLRVHWLPLSSTMNSTDDLELFVQLVKHELRIISMASSQ